MTEGLLLEIDDGHIVLSPALTAAANINTVSSSGSSVPLAPSVRAAAALLLSLRRDSAMDPFGLDATRPASCQALHAALLAASPHFAKSCSLPTSAISDLLNDSSDSGGTSGTGGLSLVGQDLIAVQWRLCDPTPPSLGLRGEVEGFVLLGEASEAHASRLLAPVPPAPIEQVRLLSSFFTVRTPCDKKSVSCFIFLALFVSSESCSGERRLFGMRFTGSRRMPCRCHPRSLPPGALSSLTSRISSALTAPHRPTHPSTK
jgi:hypothetical protein